MFDKLKKLFASPASEEQNTEVFKKQKLSPTEEMILEDDHIWQHKLWRRWFTPELYSEIRSYKGGWYSFKESACYERWNDAFKGTGAYFTMKNLILFHGCRIHLGEQVLGKDESFGYMKQTAFNEETTGKEMFAMMMKLISDNNYFYSSRKSY